MAIKNRPEFHVPRRKFSEKDPNKAKRMISWRLPGPLIEELEKVANEKGCSTTDLVNLVLDQYLQWEAVQRNNQP